MMACGAGPQLKVMVPLALRAVVKAASVQLAGSPVPTTASAATDSAVRWSTNVESSSRRGVASHLRICRGHAGAGWTRARDARTRDGVRRTTEPRDADHMMGA